MSRSRPMLAALASVTLLLVALSTTLAVSSRTGGAAGLAADGDLLAADAIGHVVVSELMTGGASASDELIELYNPSAAALPLEGLEVIYVTATGGTITRKASWAAGAPSMPAGAHVLIANAAGVFGQIADITYTNGLAAAGGSVAIRIIGASSAIDAAGWGTAANAWMEGTAAVAAAAGHSLERLPGGTAGSGQDTDQNSADFVERDTPDPQGSGSPPIPFSTPQPTTTPAASPSAAQTTMPTPGATSTPSPTSTPAPSATPIASPSASPTPSPQPATPSPSPDATPSATPMTIATARAMADGASVVVEGVSLADGTFSDGGGYLADATGGIAVLVSGGIFPRGTALRVQGELDQRFSQRTIRASATNVTILGPGSEPAAAPATTGSIGEESEGELVEIEGTIVSSQTTLTTGIAIDLDDGSGPIRVMVGTATGVDTRTWLRDTRLHLRGVVGQRDSSGSGTAGYRVQPRDPGDVLDVTPPATPSPTPSAAPSATPLPSPGPSVVSIAAARAAAVNARLTVRGVITLPSGLAEVGEAAIQDSSGAILLRLGDEAGSLALGDLVEVSGTRSTSAGMETIRVATPARRLGNRTQPASVRRATGELGEAQEAMLVVTRGAVTVTPRRTSAQNVYFDIDDGSGPIRVFVSPRAGIQTDAILMGSVLEIGGVLGQETTGKLPDRGYRLWPRGPSDLDVVSAAPGATPGGAPGGGSGGQSAGGDDGPVGGSSHGGQPVGPVASNPPRQQHVPRLEAPAPTAALPSAIQGSDAGPGPTATEAPQPERSNPEPASAAMLVLAALLLGGGGVAAAPPGLVHRLRVALRQRLGNGFATPDADEMPPTAALGGAPGLVPLSVVADGPERAGRILPPT